MQIVINRVKVVAERPLLLFTQETGNAPRTIFLVAHEKHQFVAVVHLLQEADVGSIEKKSLYLLGCIVRSSESVVIF